GAEEGTGGRFDRPRPRSASLGGGAGPGHERLHAVELQPGRSRDPRAGATEARDLRGHDLSRIGVEPGGEEAGRETSRRSHRQARENPVEAMRPRLGITLAGIFLTLAPATD